MGLVKEFREFALKGNVLDLAVGVVIGGAFGKIVSSLIEDVIMPVVGLAGNVDFSKAQYLLKGKDAAVAGSQDIFLRYGNFITIVINFIILAFVLFLVIKAFNEAKKRFEATPPPAPAVPPPPTKDQVLLTEIRDLLAHR
jgi:large conductance mechanosensitive channel